jgi:hypothetical protein
MSFLSQPAPCTALGNLYLIRTMWWHTWILYQKADNLQVAVKLVSGVPQRKKEYLGSHSYHE